MCIITSKLEDYSGFMNSNVRRKTEAAIPAMAATGRERSETETRVKAPTLVIPPPAGAPGYCSHSGIADHVGPSQEELEPDCRVAKICPTQRFSVSERVLKELV